MSEKTKTIIAYLIAILLFLGWLATRGCSDEINDLDDLNDLIPAIIEVESGGNPNALSEDGCRGIAQFSKIAWDEVMSKPYIPNVYNIELSKIACKRYLLLLKKRLGKDYTLERMIASYNMGLSKLQKLDYQWWKIKETKNYVKKVVISYCAYWG